MKTPSIQQGIIMKRVVETPDSLLIEAAAGSGKTTTLEMVIAAINSMSPMFNILYVVFNKGIQKEAKQRFGKKYFNLDILTSHGLGMRDCQKAFGGGAVLDTMKTHKLIARLEPDKAKHAEIRNLITYILAADVNIELSDSLLQIHNVARFYGIQAENNRLYEVARQVIADSREIRHTISYDDMIDQPLNVGLSPCTQYDFILVDEAQDLNNQQMRFITRYAHNGARFVCVGDRFQSIYGFRGANFDAMDTLKHYLGLKELPLSVCYRCGSNIIDFARTITTTIEAAPNAVEGQIYTRDSSQLTETLKDITNGDMMVCRTNAPLVKAALILLRMNKRPNLLGRDFGESLVRLVQRFTKVSDWATFEDKFNSYIENRITKLLELERTQEVELLQDKKDAIGVLCEDIESPQKLVGKIQSIFAEASHSGITLSTIHKAKGLEAGKVVFLDYTNVPHPMAFKAANRDKALQQENNLKYVAITRAKHTLILQEWSK